MANASISCRAGLQILLNINFTKLILLLREDEKKNIASALIIVCLLDKTQNEKKKC